MPGVPAAVQSRLAVGPTFARELIPGRTGSDRRGGGRTVRYLEDAEEPADAARCTADGEEGVADPPVVAAHRPRERRRDARPVFLEAFAGEANLTAAAASMGFRMLPPIDIREGGQCDFSEEVVLRDLLTTMGATLIGFT